ncbi:MAG: choice-of-anchor D domain-containing protein [Acidobacteria bacterium]|nr:choice-of-anchor D domain-containing protein [Acidobacteriota bacterium]
MEHMRFSRRELLVLALVALGGMIAAASAQEQYTGLPERGLTTAHRGLLLQDFGRLPLSFEANDGQSDARVKFLSRGPGYTLFLTDTEAVFAVRSAAAVSVLRMRLLGANPNTTLTGLEELPGKSHYFIGSDPAHWRTDVGHFARVRYHELYPGIDLVFYGNQRQLEFDFVVSPGAGPKAIQLAFEGAGKVELNPQGNVVIHIGGSEVRLRKPLAYQELNGTRREISCSYTLDTGMVGLQLATYDPRKPLIIDPVLEYSTSLGGTGFDEAWAIAVDATGNAYVTGDTASPDFPTVSPIQGPLGSSDVFVAKFNSAGSGLVYSTYLGGASAEFGFGIAVDANGNAYVTGRTDSTNFPTASPFQAAFGGNADAFLSKLNAAGSALVYSTYLGGSNSEQGHAIAVDASGNAYVTGHTESTNFPTANAFQAAFGGNADAFLSKFNAAGSALVYSTYLGGTQYEEGNSVAVDAGGSAYVTGRTDSTNFPTASPFQATFGANGDAFLSKFNAAGSALAYSTYLGGINFEVGTGIAVDTTGNAYVTGYTHSGNFPTASPLQAVIAGQSDVFVTKFNAAGSGLVYSTYLGGADFDTTGGIAVDGSGNAHITGVTSSTNFPTSSPLQAALVQGECFDYYYYYGGTFPCGTDAFVAKLNAAGSTLLYSTYLGAPGATFDQGRGVGLDAGGNAYVTGLMIFGFPFTPGSFQPFVSGNSDAFVAKISAGDGPGFALDRFSLTFADEGVGSTSPAQLLRLSNTGSAALDIGSISPSGDFNATHTCGTGIAGGASCEITVTFTPTAEGARMGTLTITDSASGSPHAVALNGTGLAGLAAMFSPSSIDFGNQTVDVASAGQTVTLTNTGTATLTIRGVSVVGTNPADFTFSNNCFGELAVSTSCTLSVSFQPTDVGPRSASVQVLDNSAESPRLVPLAGTGVPGPNVALAPASLSFSGQLVGTTSAEQSITLTADGEGTLVISSIGTTTAEFNVAHDCGGSLAGSASCTLRVTFRPTATGTRTATLVIADNAADSPQMVALSGLGTDFSLTLAAGSSTSATINAGQTATFSLSVSGSTGFSGTVSFSCSGTLPAGRCTVSPTSAAVTDAAPATLAVTVTTTARAQLPPGGRPPVLPSPGLQLVLSWLLLGLILALLARLLGWPRRRAWVGLMLAAALFFAASLGGCGGGDGDAPRPGTPAGNYLFTVTASSGGASHSINLNVTVR